MPFWIYEVEKDGAWNAEAYEEYRTDERGMAYKTNKVEVVNNAGKEFRITVDHTSDGARITIDNDNDLRLSEVSPRGSFKDYDGDEYIAIEHFGDETTRIIRKDPLMVYWITGKQRVTLVY